MTLVLTFDAIPAVIKIPFDDFKLCEPKWIDAIQDFFKADNLVRASLALSFLICRCRPVDIYEEGGEGNACQG